MCSALCCGVICSSFDCNMLFTPSQYVSHFILYIASLNTKGGGGGHAKCEDAALRQGMEFTLVSRQQIANFLVRGLREIVVPPADPIEVRWRVRANNLIHL